MSVIITDFSKDDIVEMSGVMRIMNSEMNNIKSVDELIDRIKDFSDDTIRVSEVIEIIKEYCKIENETQKSELENPFNDSRFGS